ncbi:MAG: hypothetical protein JWO83_4369 [Caulobacteraceae bacterium]|nr:hypothetical protein [Caulobacteraceae bacterium]
MARLKAWVAGLSVLGALLAGPALARTAHAKHTTRAAHAYGRSCCRAPAGAAVQVELAEPVSTRHQKTGDTFNLRLAAPLIVGDRVLLREGTPGVGTVVEASRPGLGGKAAKLVLAAQYLDAHGRRVPLRGLQLARAGRNNAAQASAVGLTGIVFAPLGFIGLAVRGGNVDFPEGERASARLASDVVLPPLGQATAAERGAETTRAGQDAAEHGSIAIPPPPAGKAQVVFFRSRSLLALGQWFKVRENGKAICKLTNGAYCIYVTDPGTHIYTAKFEPELRDHLTLQVDKGDTYYVEGTTNKALLIGAADLYPSDKGSFDLASKRLKPAPPVAANGADDGPDEKTDSPKAADSKP